MQGKETGTSTPRMKATVLRKWIDLVFDTYPPDTAAVLKSRGDRFANPVSYTIVSNLGKILDGLLDGVEVETLFPCLEEIIKIRAVQNFTPETAVCFMPLLKQAIGSESDFKVTEGMNVKIEKLSVACVNIYNDCRKKIEIIQAREKEKSAINLQRMMGVLEEGR